MTDEVGLGAQPRCQHCGVLMRPDSKSGGDTCPSCGHREAWVQAERPDDDGRHLWRID